MCSIRDVNIFSVEMAADSHLLTQTEAGLGKWRVLVYYVVTLLALYAFTCTLFAQMPALF